MDEKLKILIVDDEEWICESLGDILETLGHDVDKSYSGKSAIDMAKKKTYDLAFIDMKMPDLDGTETYIGIKKVNPDIKTVIITAYMQEAKKSVDKALEHDAYACLYKPCHPQKIVDIVKVIARSKRSS